MLRRTASEDASAQPAAMTPENQIEADEGDHHEGYYYPKPGSFEHYPARVYTLPESDRVRRQAFIIGLTKQLVGGQYAPSYAIFAKGNASDKLIIVALADGQLNTIYRARALLATFTSVARSTSFFQQNTQPDEATFLDLLEAAGVQARDAQRRARVRAPDHHRLGRNFLDEAHSPLRRHAGLEPRSTSSAARATCGMDPGSRPG